MYFYNKITIYMAKPSKGTEYENMTLKQCKILQPVDVWNSNGNTVKSAIGITDDHREGQSAW